MAAGVWARSTEQQPSSSLARPTGTPTIGRTGAPRGTRNETRDKEVVTMKVLYTAAVIAALAAAPSWGACTYPTAPGNMPDGNTATRDDMLAAKKQVQEFDKLITAYTECLKLEN